MHRRLPCVALLAALAVTAVSADSIDTIEDIGGAGEAPRPLVELGARVAYNTDHGAVAGLSVATDRLFGSHRLRFAAELGEERRRLNLSYGADGLLGENPSLGIGAFAMTSEAGEVYVFDSETVGIEPRLSWALGPDTTLDAYLGLSWASIDDVDPATSILVREDEGDRMRQVIGLDLGRAVGGEHGALQRLAYGATVEAGRTDRDHEFAQLSARLGAAWTFGEESPVILRAQMRGSAIESFEGESHIGDRIFLGSSSIRGFAFGGFGPRDLAAPGDPALGGNRFAVAQFDAQFPGIAPTGRLMPGIFLDMGSLWDLDDTAGGPAGADPVDDSFSLRASAGVSLQIRTGVGPVTFSVAHPFEREDYDRIQEFSLTFQQSF